MVGATAGGVGVVLMGAVIAGWLIIAGVVIGLIITVGATTGGIGTAITGFTGLNVGVLLTGTFNTGGGVDGGVGVVITGGITG